MPISTSEEKLMGIMDDAEKEAKKKGTGIIDVLSEKLLSRKLLVWIVSTIFLAVGKISADEWMSISLGYIGIQGVTEMANSWRGAKK